MERDNFRALFRLTGDLGVFYNERQILPHLVPEAMKERRVIFFMLFVTLLFAFACVYSPYDKVREADLPLKILVWVDAEGKVWISYNSPEYLQERHRIPAELLPNIAVAEGLAAKAAE